MQILGVAIRDTNNHAGRLAAIKTLARFASYSGLGSSLYRTDPWLLRYLTEVMVNDTSSDIRHASISAFGSLGALDPGNMNVSESVTIVIML